MKQFILSFLVFVLAAGMAAAQEAEISISKRLGVYVFPTNNQDSETQEYDEYKCYKWAIEASGIDPLDINVQAEQVNTGPDGSAVVGAAKGAAVGAAIGAIAGNAGKGAAIGATAGGFSGIGRGAARRQASQQQANQAATQQEAQMREEFNKAFSVCMEGKGYTVK